MHRDDLSLQPTEGERTPPTASERLVVGGAGIALLAGLVIAIANFVGSAGEEGTASSTASVAPSAVPSPEASPRPVPTRTPRPLGAFTVEPGVPPPASPQPITFFGWIRADTDLVMRVRPTPDSPEIGRPLPAGTPAFVAEEPGPAVDPGWLHIQAPSVGWIHAPEGGTPAVQRFPLYPMEASGEIWTVTGGGNGFVAQGWSPQTRDAASVPLIVASADGAAWDPAEFPPAGLPGFATVAWGPAGWLAFTELNVSAGPSLWTWGSIDGRTWTPIGSVPGAARSAQQVVASGAGYLLTAIPSRSSSSLWFSSDGRTWREAFIPELERGAWVRTVGTAHGFLAWDDRSRSADPALAYFSVDGSTWSSVVGGPPGPDLVVAHRGDGLLGVGHDPESGAPSAWIGVMDGWQLTWIRDREADAALAGASVSAVVADGPNAMAFGWDRETEQAIAWTIDASGWSRAAMPPEFGGIPRAAAGSEAGIVVVGSRPTLRGSNPVLWHRADDGSWAAETSPVVPLVPDGSAADCGPPPADALELVSIDRASAVRCFGGMPITVRAWSEPCEGCYGGYGGSHDEAWLAAPTTNQLFLNPADVGGGWSMFPAVVHPSIADHGVQTRQWVEVTGHFDDPASAACRWIPGPAELAYYSGQQQTINGCRTQFVVTAIRAAP